MHMSIRRQTTVAVAIAAITLSALSGCSAVTKAVAQTKPVACKQLSVSLTKITSGISSSLGEFSSDPDAAVTGLQSADSSLKSSLTKIENPQVKKVGSTAEASLAKLIADLKAYVADPGSGTTALQADSTAAQTDFEAIDKVCA